MTNAMTRAQLLSRSAMGGAALLVGGAAMTELVDAAKGEPLPDGDLAYARLLVGAELLGANFYEQALASGSTRPKLRKHLRRALANEQEHYKSVAAILSGAGLVPALASDIDYSYPRGTFATPGSIVTQALELEMIMLGAYLGAIAEMQSNALKSGIARIAASEAMHVGYFAQAKGRNAFMSFPPALMIEEASNALDRFIA